MYPFNFYFILFFFSMYPLSNETESGDDETSSEDMEVSYIMQSQ